MASPRLESMCCINTTQHGQSTLLGTRVYNITCIVSASLSILGAVYLLLPRKIPENARRRKNLGYERQIKIINWLTLADLLACIGILVRSSTWLSMYGIFKNIPTHKTGHKNARIFCAISGAWIQYFYITTYFWTFSFAVDIFLLMRNRTSEMWLYHVLSWIISAVLCVDGLITLYFPSLIECEQREINLLPHYMATLIPILMVMICNPILYFISSRKVSKFLALTSGRYTDQERLLVKQVKEKFAMILAVFFVCWLPNVVNGFIILCQHSKDSYNGGVIALDVMMGILNPLQAFFNALIYRGWAGCSEIRQPFGGHSVQVGERRPSVRAVPVPSTNRRKGSAPIERDEEEEVTENTSLLRG
ncbi:G-protein coupled receptor 143-like [Glandiceps talaboti]